MGEVFTSFLISVIAGVVSHYICKWLDLSFYSKKTPTSKVGDELRLLPT